MAGRPPTGHADATRQAPRLRAGARGCVPLLERLAPPTAPCATIFKFLFDEGNYKYEAFGICPFYIGIYSETL